MPTCLARGDYLLRVETLALHSAYKTGEAQFYQSCVQINLNSSGSKVPSETVSFPGAYSRLLVPPPKNEIKTDRLLQKPAIPASQ